MPAASSSGSSPPASSADVRARIGAPPRGHGFLGLIIRENRSIRIPDIAVDPRRYGFPPHHPPMHSFLGVPVTVKGRSVGNLYLTDKAGAGEFSEADQRLVETFAVHAGIAIENARLHEQVQRLAIVDERERIGKDLHDGIIQNLYAIGLSLEDVADLIHDDPDEVERRVERAIDSLHVTIRDIRNFIFGLRPELLSGTTLDGRPGRDHRGVPPQLDDRRRAAARRRSSTSRTRPRPPTCWRSPTRPCSNIARHSGATAGDHGRPIPRSTAASGWSSMTTAAVSIRRRSAGLGHQGLANMRSRVATIGGTMEHRQRRDRNA